MKLILITLALFAGLGLRDARAEGNSILPLRHALLCLCSMPIIPHTPPTKASIENDLRTWLNTLKMSSHSQFDYFVGKPVDGDFAGSSAVRFLVIVPSEYVRDSQAEWDEFKLILTFQGEIFPVAILTTEAYKYRSKGFIVQGTPSPDWEFSSPDGLDISDSRLALIAGALKRVAENSKTIFVIPNNPPSVKK